MVFFKQIKTVTKIKNKKRKQLQLLTFFNNE